MPTAPRAVASPPKGRLSKPTGNGAATRSLVNTDLSAHPRTNPVAALNTLVKLLTSLSTRIGRCQYKLTPSEHALSLHLVSILDPYVFQGAKVLSNAASTQVKPTFAGLVFQPTEIVDSIIAYLDSKRDLMNVALCCKHLHDVVFPRHFEYRVIRCKVSSISVWNHLIVNQSLARNVRRLEIIDERSAVAASTTPRVSTNATTSTTGVKAGGMVVPRGITQRDTDLESTDDELRMHSKQEKYLSSALQCMSGLKELKWSSNQSPVSIVKTWGAVMGRMDTLNTLEVHDTLVFSPETASEEVTSSSGSESEDDEPKDAKVLTPVSAVTSAVFRSTRSSYGSSKTPDLSRINDVIARCPQLKSLVVAYTRGRGIQSSTSYPLVDDILDGRWSNLNSLVLTGLRTTSTSALSALLSDHPTLETLHLDIAGVRADNLDLRLGSLPRLREIHAAKDVINAILSSGSSSADEPIRPLETVKGPRLSGVHAIYHGKHVDDAFIHTLKRYASTLSRVELGGWHDMDDIRKLTSALPNLSYLDVGKRLGLGTRGGKDASGPVTNLEEWFEVLTTLPELRALHGVKLFYEISSINLPSYTSQTTVPSSLTHHSTSGAQASTSVSGSIAASFGGDRIDTTVAAKLQSQMSLMDRSRMKKNDWTASMLVWRCPKLRRVDHWEEGSSKIVVLSRASNAVEKEVGGEGADGASREAGSGKVRWEVKRLKMVAN